MVKRNRAWSKRRSWHRDTHTPARAHWSGRRVAGKCSLFFQKCLDCLQFICFVCLHDYKLLNRFYAKLGWRRGLSSELTPLTSGVMQIKGGIQNSPPPTHTFFKHMAFIFSCKILRSTKMDCWVLVEVCALLITIQYEHIFLPFYIYLHMTLMLMDGRELSSLMLKYQS